MQAPAPLLVILVSGFLDQSLGRAVLNFDAAFREAYPDIATHRFTFDQRRAIEKLISAQPPETRIRLVGHSWGGNTAAKIAGKLGAAGRKLDLLMTIDPVGRGAGPAFFRRVRLGARRWINVNAVGGPRWGLSDVTRRVGDAYDDKPLGHADEFIRAPVEHRQFGSMLTSRTSSGLTLLEEITASPD